MSGQILEVLEDQAGKEAVAGLVKTWHGMAELEKAYAAYRMQNGDKADPDAKNTAQKSLRLAFAPFFSELHACLKQIDKAVRRHEKALAEEAKAAGRRKTADRATKQLKTALEALHAEVKSAENYFGHIQWLQDRFPEARYEDVTGLCKLAGLDEIREQDYSLNPGRYVGVVIEEDGKTEEEFVAELTEMNDQLLQIRNVVHQLEAVIDHNIKTVIGE